MKQTKRFFAMALAGALTVGCLAGCGGSSSDAAAPAGSAPGSAAAASSSDSKGTIQVITMALNTDYWHAVQAGAIQAGKDFGYEVNVIGPNDESNAQEQCNEILDAAANGVDAIVVAANNPDTVSSTIAEVHAQGIPVVAMEVTVPDEDAYDAWVGVDNYKIEKQLADYIGETYDDLHVGIIRGIVGTEIHDIRCQGIEDGITEAGGEIVSVQPADSDRAKAVNVAENMLQANPEINAFVATNDEMALGAYEAVKAAGKEDEIVVFGIDGSTGALESIIKGELTGTLDVVATNLGYNSVEVATKILEGKDYDKENEDEVVIATKENAQQLYDDLKTSLANAGF